MWGGKRLFSEFRQPTQSGFLEKDSPCEPLVFRRHLCFLSLGQVAHPLPELSSLPRTEDSMWFLGLPHQAAGRSQPWSSISGQRLGVSCFRCAGPLWVWSVSHGRRFSTGMSWLRAGLVRAIPWGYASTPGLTSLPLHSAGALAKPQKLKDPQVEAPTTCSPHCLNLQGHPLTWRCIYW